MRDWPAWNCAYCHVLGVALWCHQIWVAWLKERLDVLLHSEREVPVHVPSPVRMLFVIRNINVERGKI